MKPDPADQAIEKLSAACPDTPEGRKLFASALTSRYNRVIAKAAKILDNLRVSDLCPQMAEALTRLFSKGEASDKGCVAMLSLARALVNLDHDDAELYLKGMKYVQKEASWGPPVDTAVDLRATCAMGLVNGLYPSKYNPLIELLVDAEWGARSGAVRALAALGTEPAYVLLRYKARIGDENPEVLSTCLEALLAGEGASALPLVTTIALSADPEIREAAILALGASRRDDAVAWLIQRSVEAVRESERRPLYLALSSSRTDPALNYLFELLRTASSSTFASVNEALAIHSRDSQLRDRLEAAIRARSTKTD
jgi:HEAT repeat protein